MNTVDPRAFVDFKRWMSGLKDRQADKRARDALQAAEVEKMIEGYLPLLDR